MAAENVEWSFQDCDLSCLLTTAANLQKPPHWRTLLILNANSLIRPQVQTFAWLIPRPAGWGTSSWRLSLLYLLGTLPCGPVLGPPPCSPALGPGLGMGLISEFMVAQLEAEIWVHLKAGQTPTRGATRVGCIDGCWLHPHQMKLAVENVHIGLSKVLLLVCCCFPV